MITGVHIEKLRGIREGRLEGLTPLTILVGPSGSGKSTVLDALLIGVSDFPGDAIGRAIRRRAELRAGAPWLFERKGPRAVIRVDGDEKLTRASTLTWTEEHPGSGAFQVNCEVTSSSRGAAGLSTLLAVDNSYSTTGAVPSRGVFVRLVEATAGTNHAPLVRVHKEARERNARMVDTLVPALLEGARGLRIDTYEEDGKDVPLLLIDFADYSVPVAGAGSGIYAVVRLALEVAAPPGGIVLVEEPEAHQHPEVIAQAAKVLLDAARRDVQLIVSTHSLELIDALVANASKDDLEKLTVFRLVLDDGLLRSSRFSGDMVATARGSLHEDLR